MCVGRAVCAQGPPIPFPLVLQWRSAAHAQAFESADTTACATTVPSLTSEKILRCAQCKPGSCGREARWLTVYVAIFPCCSLQSQRHRSLREKRFDKSAVAAARVRLRQSIKRCERLLLVGLSLDLIFPFPARSTSARSTTSSWRAWCRRRRAASEAARPPWCSLTNMPSMNASASSFSKR